MAKFSRISLCLLALIGCSSSSPIPTKLSLQTVTPTSSVASSQSATPEANQMLALLEKLLFFPAKFPEGDWNPPGLRFEDAWFTAEDGAKLHGWYCPVENPKAVILFAHGNAGNLSHRAHRLIHFQKNLGVSCLIFDYRGYGRSEGKPDVAGILKDGRAARRFLAEKSGLPETKLVLMGESLGGAVVVDLAADGARGLILENTFSSIRDVADIHYAALSWLIPKTILNSETRIAPYSGPLLQCHGDADRIIPYSLGKKLHEAAKGKKELITVPGGDHNDAPSHAYLNALAKFLGELPD